MPSPDLVIAVEVDGTGAHPAAWRLPDSRAEDLFGAAYWIDVARAAEALGADLLLLPDSFRADVRRELPRGRFDATMLAARVAPHTSRIGLVPTATVTHTEPFHLSRALATVDYVSHGRVGWEVAVSTTEPEAALFGRKGVQSPESLWAEAAEAVTVVVGLWDSWDDDAEIRDVATGRFVDRNRLHYLDFAGEYFAVKGPSVTQRPPQGNPPIVIRADTGPALDLAARSADLVRIAAPDLASARAAANRVRSAVAAAGRPVDDVTVLFDVEVLLAADERTAVTELARLDTWQPTRPESLRHIGDARSLAGLLDQLRADDAIGGVTLRPLALPGFLATAGRLGPDRHGTLRDRLGLPRPAGRFAVSHT